MDTLWLVLSLLLIGAFFGLILGQKIAQAIERWRLRRRYKRGAQGEKEGSTLLRTAGYRILASQETLSLTVEINGEDRDYRVRPDAIAQRRGKLYVVEFKTGKVATSPLYRETRRQLLEYYHALPVEGVLLVDVESQKIYTLRFPLRSGKSFYFFKVAFAFLFGVCVGLLLLVVLS